MKSFSRASMELTLSPSNHGTEAWRVSQGHWQVGTRRQLGMGQLATELSLWGLLFHRHPCLPSPYCLRLSLESDHEAETPKARGSCPDLAGQAQGRWIYSCKSSTG